LIGEPHLRERQRHASHVGEEVAGHRRVMFLSQVFDGLLLPIILVFVTLIVRDRRLMGRLRSGAIGISRGWLVTGLMSLLSIALVVSTLVG
jgi:Mn2+/Fe2+ NRAMP family transporter